LNPGSAWSQLNVDCLYCTSLRSVRYWSLGCLTSSLVEEGGGFHAMVWCTQAVANVAWDSGVATSGRTTGFTVRVASCISRKRDWEMNLLKWHYYQEDCFQHTTWRFAAEVSLCDVRRGKPTSVYCKVGQVRAVCCAASMEQEQLSGRPENRTRQKCWLINSLRFYWQEPCEFTSPPPPS
jgi:hypothetical protein